MTNPFFSQYDPIKTELAQQIQQAFTTLTSNATANSELSSDTIARCLEMPPDLKMGDYALPCFRFAKALRQAPAAIAQGLKEALSQSESPWIERLEVVGAFLNIFTRKPQLAQLLLPHILDESYFSALQRRGEQAKTRVMIEFSQPNTHKEFHVGHARNVSLGDALTRIFAYNAFQVIPVNYIGDEGTHVAKCLWQVSQFHGPKPTEKYSQWYGQRYVEANNKLKAATDDEKRQYNREISEVLNQIEAKEGPFYDLWLQSRSECLCDFETIYQWLGVQFQHVFYESEVSQESQSIVDEYLAQGLLVESQGAIGIPMDEYGLGFFMARKSDGTSLYITKDLALARRKFKDFQIDRSIYVVGSEQNFHFRQLFKALELMGFEQASQCYHLSYAHVTLPEGKISSRQGNAFTFAQLVEMMQAELAEHLKKYEGQWSPAEIDETSHKLAVGAIKYGMLNADPQKEIVFDPKVWTSFEGNTGPYLMYSYSRTCSILRKCAESGYEANCQHLAKLEHPLEHELLRLLYEFNDTCRQACDSYKPSLIANHLFNLCKAFNRFYAEQSVIKAPDEQSRSARMALVKAFNITLRQGLGLLGMSPPEKM